MYARGPFLPFLPFNYLQPCPVELGILKEELPVAKSFLRSELWFESTPFRRCCFKASAPCSIISSLRIELGIWGADMIVNDAEIASIQTQASWSASLSTCRVENLSLWRSMINSSKGEIGSCLQSSNLFLFPGSTIYQKKLFIDFVKGHIS